MYMWLVFFQMFEGKERRRQLIEELRTTHALQAPEQKIKKQEAEQIDKKKLQEKWLLHKVRGRVCANRYSCVFDTTMVYLWELPSCTNMIP